jgi:hypothetical protein
VHRCNKVRTNLARVALPGRGNGLPHTWRPLSIDPTAASHSPQCADGEFSLPPFGLNLFASNALFETPPLPILYRGVLPLILIYGAVLILLTYVPAITLAPLNWMR